MSSPNILFLELNAIDGKFHVHDEKGHAFGGGCDNPIDTIQHARMVSDAPIQFGGHFADFQCICVPEKPDGAIADAEAFIAALAEISGMRVIKNYNDDMHFIGYSMELIE